jgi:hypothetical protein
LDRATDHPADKRRDGFGYLNFMKNIKKHIKIPLLSILMLISACGSSSPSSIAQDYSGNPFIDTSGLRSNLSTFNNSFDANQIPNQWPNYGIGDPYVYRYNGTYYLYPSTSNRGVRAYKSYDLMNWEPVTGEGLPYGYVLSPDYDSTIVAYAPEVIYNDGWFYMCQSQAGTGHYFYKSRSPEGPFVPYTGNVGESIDGSFFIDNDGETYFLRAKAETIRMIKFNEDFTLSNQAFDIQNTSMGGWTEGPYMLSLNGTYYLTFTGVHVASTGYKVGYSYMNGSDTVFVRDGFTRGDNILMNTDTNWHTLGHSSTTLGPDMDSYYIAYHSRTNGVHGRHFNLSRLLFNGTEMAVDRPSLTGTVIPNMPDFYTHEPLEDLEQSGSFLLSSQETNETFTAEWNFIGSTGRYVFSHTGTNNYSYLTFDGEEVKLHQIIDGADTLIHTIDLNKSYDTSVLHSLRVGYSNGKLDLYFDNMQKLDDFAFEAVGGKIGYHGTGFTPYYTAFSNTAQGKSDKTYSKQQIAYANAYDENVSSLSNSTLAPILAPQEQDDDFNGKVASNVLKLRGNDHASMRIYVNETGTYQVTMRISRESLGKRMALKVENGNPIEITLPTYDIDAPYINVNVTNLTLTKGEHYLSIVRRQDIDFVALKFDKTVNQTGTYENSLITLDGTIDIRGAGYDVSENGLTSRTERSIAFIDKDGYTDVEVSVQMTFNGSSSFNSSGIVVRADNDAYGQWDDINSLQGYYFGVKNTQAFLIRADYQAMSKQLAINFANVPSDQAVTLKVIAKGNQLTFYVDDVEEFSIIDPNAYFHGRVGLYSTGASTTFKNILITPI